MQLTQQVALAILAGMRLLKCRGESTILAILREVGQSDCELDADKVGEVAPVGVIHFHGEVRLVGLSREGDVRRRGFDLLIEPADHRMMVGARHQARQRS